MGREISRPLRKVPEVASSLVCRSRVSGSVSLLDYWVCKVAVQKLSAIPIHLLLPRLSTWRFDHHLSVVTFDSDQAEPKSVKQLAVNQLDSAVPHCNIVSV